jgi:P-type Ca2+ transporter type 2C
MNITVDQNYYFIGETNANKE